MERIARFQQQVIAVRAAATSPENYRASVGGYLAEFDRMLLEVRDYPVGAAGKGIRRAGYRIAPVCAKYHKGTELGTELLSLILKVRAACPLFLSSIFGA